MKKLIICLVLFLVSPPCAFGQDKQAITDEGRTVILKDNGTWEYAEDQGETLPDPESIIYPARPYARLLGMAVSQAGKVYALVDDGFEIMDVNAGRSSPRRFDPKGTVDPYRSDSRSIRNTPHRYGFPGVLTFTLAISCPSGVIPIRLPFGPPVETSCNRPPSMT